ncbi:MAG: SRPBCC family protein [Anaerolineales bacterium]|jgi:hypothetical protein
MDFDLSIWIEQPPEVVFALLRDKDLHPREASSPVLALDKTTPGPVQVGTRYREVVQMLPFYQGEILSEITRFEPVACIEEVFHGAGMAGVLVYEFVPEDGGTRLVQRESLHYGGLLRLLEPAIKLFLGRRLKGRLEEIKAYLEGANSER